MGYLLKEALKTICGVNQWSYAVFWKIGIQNPKLLIWEECYYEPVTYISGLQNPELGLDEWESCWISTESRTSRVGAGNNINLLVNKMMMDNHVNILGEGLVGRAAFTGNHQWVFPENFLREVQTPEVLNEVSQQRSAGMQTITVIPVLPHGVVQLGSSLAIMEDMGFINDVKSLILQLGCVPGALFSDTCTTTKEPAQKTEISIDSFSAQLPGKAKMTDSPSFIADSFLQQTNSAPASSSVTGQTYPLTRKTQDNIIHSTVRSNDNVCSAKVIPSNPDLWLNQKDSAFGQPSGGQPYGSVWSENFHGFSGSLENVESFSTGVPAYGYANNMTINQENLNEKPGQSDLFQLQNQTDIFHPRSGDDLFDVLGVDLKNQLLNRTWNNSIDNNHTKHSEKNQDSDFYSVNKENSDSGIFSASNSDHLLEAVVTNAAHSTGKNSDDNISGKTALTNIASSTVSLTKSGVMGSCSSVRSGPSKEDKRSFSQSNSVYGSQISAWVEQGKDIKRNSSASTGFSKRPDEQNKPNRKRLKPGENPRPRPKDRQMIQDRVKELREIVPNGAKCSIDSLLERTIKHMLFLQSVTKHADKLRQTGDSKIISKEGGIMLKDNIEGGATWAYEVGSQSMVCPIIVEDLNPPRQMLVEMLCEERGIFLEIADIIRGLGLTILKGVMENRKDKIWARFAVEANRDVTRMEIFLSLVRLLEQTVKTGTVPAGCLENDNMMTHHSFHQSPSIPATGRPCTM
jgi:hypothetical protein